MALRTLGKRNQLARMAKQLLAYMCQPYTLPGTTKQACRAELRLERAYLLAYSGLRESKTTGGRGKAPGVGNCQKCAQLVRVQHLIG